MAIIDKKAFTLLELIFVVMILAILLSQAVPKFYEYFHSTNILKARGDVLLIRSSINEYRNELLLKNTTAQYPVTLDTIFTNLNINTFIKKSDSIYEVKIDNSSIEFKYEKDIGKFDCLHKVQEYCEDITR